MQHGKATIAWVHYGSRNVHTFSDCTCDVTASNMTVKYQDQVVTTLKCSDSEYDLDISCDQGTELYNGDTIVDSNVMFMCQRNFNYKCRGKGRSLYCCKPKIACIITVDVDVNESVRASRFFISCLL